MTEQLLCEAGDVRSAPLARDALDAAARLLASAFTGDPIIEWIAPTAPARVGFFAALLGGVEPMADWVEFAPGREAVAVWIPSERLRAGPTVRELLSVPGMFRAAGPWGSVRLARFGLALAVHHRIAAPHDYLMLLGVQPGARGKQLGSRLLRDHLERLDALGRGAFLETSNAANVAFYEKHGFTVLKAFKPPGGGPPLWSMWRPGGAARGGHPLQRTGF